MGLFGRKKTGDAPSGPDTAAMDPLDVLRQARPWLMRADFLPAEMLESSFRYRREIGDELVAVIAVAHPEHATLMTDDEVAAFDLEALWTVALQSLQSEPIDEILPIGTGDTECQVVFGFSAFTSSRLLVMPDLLNHVTGSAEAPLGVIVAVPSQNQLVLHVVRGLEAIQAVSGIYDYAEKMYADAKSALSPNVYFWRSEGLKRMTFREGDGRIEIRYEEEIVSAMMGLDDGRPTTGDAS